MSVLNLTARASHCLLDLPTLGALLESIEAQLMRRRNFGRTTLLDVRRKLVHYFVDHGDPAGETVIDPRRVREALYDPHPAFAAVWATPAQARPLAEVVADLLAILSRPEELRTAEPWSYSTTSIGPPRNVDFSRASLQEVIDAVFATLKDRERCVLERRFGLLEGEAATLAEIGREFGLTRERVRQIVQACLTKLAGDGERRRRLPLLECIRRGLEESGGISSEGDLARAVKSRFPAPHPDLGPVLRVLLEIEPDYQPAGHRVWALSELPAEQIAAIQDAFHAHLRSAARPLTEVALLETASRLPEPGVAGDGSRPSSRRSTAFLRGCLITDGRIARMEEGLYGLAEWQWLLPRSLGDYIYLALRSAGRPRHYLWITDQVNALMPDGESVSPRDVHTALLEHAGRFVRAREGTYALAEWAGADDHPPFGDGRRPGMEAGQQSVGDGRLPASGHAHVAPAISLR